MCRLIWSCLEKIRPIFLPGIRGSSGERPRPDVKIEGPVAVSLLLVIVVKRRQPELDQQELSCGLLNLCITFGRSVESGDGVVFAVEAGELAVNRDEDGVVDGGLDQRELLGEVLARHLHSFVSTLLRLRRRLEDRFNPGREASLKSSASVVGVEIGDVGSESKAPADQHRSSKHMMSPANVVSSPVHAMTRRPIFHSNLS